MRFQLMRRATGVTLVAVMLACLAWCSRAAAQAMDQLPAQSLVVVRVNNLQNCSQKLAKLSQELGLAQMQPQLADPLGAMKKSMNIQKGLDESRDMAFAFVDPAAVKSAAGEDGEKKPTLVMLWPVTDYKAFLSNFTDAKDEGGGVSQVQFPNDSEPGFIAQWGNYAAVSPSKELVQMKPAGGALKVEGKAADVLQRNDFTVWANVPELRTKYQDALTKNRESWIKDIDDSLSKDPQTAKFAPVAKTALNQVLNAVNSILRDAKSATWSANIGDAGISTSLMADFTPGSEVGGYVQGFKASDQPLLRGLPAEKYLVFGGVEFDPATMTKLFDQIAGPVLQQTAQLPPEQSKAVQQYADAFKKALGASQSQTFGMHAPSGQLGQEPIIQFVSVVRGDAANIRASQLEMIQAQQELQNVFSRAAADLAKNRENAGNNENGGNAANGGNANAAGANPPPDLMKVNIEKDKKTIGGVQFDQVTTALNPEAQNDPRAMQAQMAMNWMYGPNGAQVLIGSVDDKDVVAASGVPDELITKTIEGVRNNTDVLGTNAAVKSVSDQLPKNRIAVMYVPLDQVVTTVANYAGAFGMQVPIQLPPDLPPIGSAVSTEGATLRVDSYVPTELIKALTAAAIQVQMQMHGGQQPGGPGGL